MPSYRLLRSNKESGPYTLNDLVALGLKAYDLVWVEGRSAAWRYPSEIGELKEFAPVQEEQPYDRFYKKPSQNTVAAEEIKQAEQNTVEPVPVYQPAPEKQVEAKTSKQVFVSMPEKPIVVKQPRQQQQYQYDQYQQYQPKPETVKEELKPAAEKSYSPINIQESEESKLETKYSQSLDDIKDMYINTLVQRKSRNKRKELIRKYSKPVLVSALLIASGIAIGYFFMGKKNAVESAQATIIAPVQKTAITGIIKDTVAIQPEKNDQVVLEREVKDELAPTHTDLIKPKHRDVEILPFARKPETGITEKKEKEKPVFNIPGNVTTYEKRAVDINQSTGERTRTTRNEDDKQVQVLNRKENTDNGNRSSKMTFIDPSPKDISKLVTVKNNEYVRGAFGGIRDLTLTLFNHSEFLLDEVKVELQIIKTSEQPLRTDIITFKNIGANAAVTVKVPDSQRGIRIEYRIMNIESKQFEKGTAGL